MGGETAARLRLHPAQRLAANECLINLDSEIDRLLQEPHSAVNGHRQEAIYKRGLVTMVVFAFEAGGFLREHVVPEGEVLIRLVDGELTVKTPEREYRLGRNDVLVLAPGVKHDVYACQPSRMLLTVHLENAHSAM
jgi:quercetin dioxygenase-like cupin family protein